MTVRIRGHHLLCMLSYVGEGYGEAFVANKSAILQRLQDGEPLQLVSGPDDICQPLLSTEAPHCFEKDVDETDRLAIVDLSLLLGKALRCGDELRYDALLVKSLRAAFCGNALRTACVGCEWSPLCDRVASSGFDGVKLFPPAETPDQA